MPPEILRPVGLGFVFALLEPEALAIHLEDMDVVCEPVEERVGEALRGKHLGRSRRRRRPDRDIGSAFAEFLEVVSSKLPPPFLTR